MKLTLVSITYRGIRHFTFVYLSYDEKGHAYFYYEKLAEKAKVFPNTTYTLD